MLSNLHPALLWLIGWVLMLIIGAISAAIVFGLASLLQWKAGWHREACMAIIGTIGFGCLIASETLQMRWLAFVGMLFGGPIFFIFAAAPLIILGYVVRWMVQKLRGTDNTGNDHT